MVRVTDELILSQKDVTLFHTFDGYLGNLPVLVFHGPSTISNNTLNSSRVQIHIFTGAGFQSYPRITISPNLPFHQAVNYLPREKQGDEISRGIAFGLLKYFKELPNIAKSTLITQYADPRSKHSGNSVSFFSEQHAAILAGAMVKVENIAEILHDIYAALRPQNINHIDLDLVLPAGITTAEQGLEIEDNLDESIMDLDLKRYGKYAPLIKLFGDATFLPTSKLRRAPSRATSINKSRSFDKDQKTFLRREMGELVDTEERYVIKMHELVHQIADDFRQKAKTHIPGSDSLSEEDLEKLFPKSLDKILQINTEFLSAVRKVMDKTEEDAMLDLESPIVTSTNSRNGGNGRPKDPTGALAFAKVLLDWFPRFSDCYQEYIRASQGFPQIITSFLKQHSSFSRRVQATGEQHLRSAVIEPVQRLPRYSLFIDNIVNCLPLLHPALQYFLKARDIITSICSMDPSETDKSLISSRLKNLVESWPKNFSYESRIVTAVDFVESLSPFQNIPASDIREGMFLLFTDRIVLLRKLPRCNLSARGFLVEVEKPSATSILANMTANASGQKRTYDLCFSSCHTLSETRFTVSDDGNSVFMVSFNDKKEGTFCHDKNSLSSFVRAYFLQGGYEGKATKFTEEVIRARIEGRFSEVERETNLWSLRSVKLAAVNLTVHTAVFEKTIDSSTERQDSAPVRILVDQSTDTKASLLHGNCLEVIAKIVPKPNRLKYRLEVYGLNDKSFSDEVVSDQLLPTLVKKVTDLLRLQYKLGNSTFTIPFISFYIEVLNSLQIKCECDKQRSFKPGSPVKLLSSLFNAAPSIYSARNFKASNKINFSSLTRSNSSKSLLSTQDLESKASLRSDPHQQLENYFARLEDSFMAYMTAINSRKGNVVGRALRNRSMIDELAVNAIYNTFIENPHDQRSASEATINVLFAALEKFLRMAWREHMGDVISLQTLDELQLQALQLTFGDFSHYVRLVLSEMTPQNRRALVAIMKLLADLLDGCSNDADRGAITAAFAELLVIEGNPHDYINLLDRLVLDQQNLFYTLGPGAVNGVSTSLFCPPNLGTRSNQSTASSVASNNSSFRKRFAETLLRQNSSNEKSSVWRSLSKNNRSVVGWDQVHQNFNPKGTVRRSRSIEPPGRLAVSRDRPTVLGAFEPRPLSSSGSTAKLNSREELPSDDKDSHKVNKKKRRSSLSDLTSIDIRATTLDRINLNYCTPSPSKIPLGIPLPDQPRSSLYHTPTKKENKILSSPSKKKEISTENSKITVTTPQSTSDVVLIKDLWKTPHRKSVSLTTTNIPTLSGRPSSNLTNTTRPPTSHSNMPKSPQKLRLQSPQKLRERIKDEAKAIKNAEADLYSELSKIGAQMARLHSSEKQSSTLQQNSQKFTLALLQSSLSTLSTRIPTIIADLTARNEVIGADLENSLQALEFKSKGLDQLYREATAENELLYERFNSDLSRIVKAVKGKVEEGAGSETRIIGTISEKVEKVDLIEKIREATEETARIRSENSRLKREVLSLKTLLKVGE